MVLQQQKLRSMKTQTPITKISVGETQTKNPKFTSQGTQDWKNTASFGSQTEGPPIFDMTMDDNRDDYINDVEAVINEEENKKKFKK